MGRRVFVIVLLAGVGFLAPAVAFAENGGAPGLGTSDLLRVGLGLVAVLAAIVALGWIVRRMGQLSGSAAGRMRVLGGVSVGNRERVVLLQVGETQLVLGVAPGRVQTLHVLDKPLEMPGTGTGSRGGEGERQAFASKLQQAMSQGTKPRKDPTL